jgi:hypothetical protein
LLWFASLFSWGADVLVLIDAKDAGPVVPIHDYIHPYWVLWADASDPAGSNRLMSIPSGMDWKPGQDDGNFQTDDPFPRAANASSLSDRGYFQAVADNLGDASIAVVAEKKGGFAPGVLRAGLTKPLQIPWAPFKGPLPDQLLVASVSGPRAWDDLADLAHRAGGRILVVELPVGEDPKWSRMWLRGKGWPTGLPSLESVRVPGLVPAKDLFKLLRSPEAFQWTPNDTQKWGAANRWLEFGHFTGPVFLVFVAVVAIYVAGCAVYAIVREERGRVSLVLLRLLVLGPAILILGGRLTATGFASNWPVWFAAAAATLGLGAFFLNLGIGRLLPAAHSMLGEMIVGFLVLVLIDPVWSVVSGSIGPRTVGTSPEALGALCAYTTGWIAFIRSSPKLDLFFFGQALVLVLVACFLGPRWLDLPYGSIVVFGVALASAMPLLCVLATLGGVATMVWFGKARYGFTYAPRDLFPTYASSKALNLADHVGFVSSSAFIGFTLFAAVVWIAGDRFFSHQVRRSLSLNRQPLALVRASLAFLVIGLASPAFLHAGMACAMAGAAVILFDTVRAG